MENTLDKKPEATTKKEGTIAIVKSATDYLAVDRTILANERTMLSYTRTGLMLLGGGVTFLKMFPNDPVTVKMGYILSSLSLPIFIFAFYRFRAMAKHIKEHYDYHK